MIATALGCGSRSQVEQGRELRWRQPLRYRRRDFGRRLPDLVEFVSNDAGNLWSGQVGRGIFESEARLEEMSGLPSRKPPARIGPSGFRNEIARGVKRLVAMIIKGRMRTEMAKASRGMAPKGHNSICFPRA